MRYVSFRRPDGTASFGRLDGETIVELSSTSLSRVRLEADDNPLFWCELGKQGEALTLRVEDDFDRHREAIDEFYGL